MGRKLLQVGLILMLGLVGSVGLFRGMAQSVSRADAPNGVLLPAWSSDQPDAERISYTGCGNGEVPAVQSIEYEAAVFDLTNQFRRQNNVPPLKRNDDLDAVARYHARDMLEDNYFSHDTYDRINGDLTKVCGTFTRVRKYYSYNSAGENIAAGYGTPDRVVNAWINSDGHRRNMLNTSYRELGVGYFRGNGGYGNYWVQDFGRQNRTYPLIINDDRLESDSRQVSLYIYGSWDEIRLRNDDGNWGPWQPFQNEMSWRLANRAGIRTVHAEMRSDSSTATASDSIGLGEEAVAGTPPEQISLTGPITGFTDIAHRFTAAVNPLDLDQPLTFTWQADEQSLQRRTRSSLQDEVAFTWANPGRKLITLTVANSVGLVTQGYAIDLSLPPEPKLGALPPLGLLNYSALTGEERNFRFTVENVGNSDVLTWRIAAAGDWFSLSATEGRTPAEVTLRPNQSITGSSWLPPQGSGTIGSGTLNGPMWLAVYTGSLRVEVLEPGGVEGSPQVIALELRVLAGDFGRLFLPLVVK